MKVLYNRIIVKQVESDDLEKSGIVIPSSAENNLLTGEVIEIGTDIDYVKVGDKVLYKEHAGEDIFLDGIPTRILLERSHVEAIL